MEKEPIHQSRSNGYVTLNGNNSPQIKRLGSLNANVPLSWMFQTQVSPISLPVIDRDPALE